MKTEVFVTAARLIVEEFERSIEEGYLVPTNLDEWYKNQGFIQLYYASEELLKHY